MDLFSNRPIFSTVKNFKNIGSSRQGTLAISTIQCLVLSKKTEINVNSQIVIFFYRNFSDFFFTSSMYLFS